MIRTGTWEHVICAICVWSVTAQSAIPAQQNLVFRPDYKYFPDAQGWIKFHKIPTTWLEARLKCYHEGAVLASPTNERLYIAMRSFMLAQNSAAFIGLQTLTATGDYFTVEGVPLEDVPLHWAKGEPDNAADAERCLAMARDGAAADVRCGDVLPYMCYRRRTGDETLTQCGTHDKEYALDAESGSCHKMHAECASWWRAHTVCASERARLAVVTSRALAERLRARFGGRDARCADRALAHIGFINNAYWFTLDGKRLAEAGYEKWAANEPNSIVPGAENCGALSLADAGLADVSCDRALPFICQMTPPDPSGQ